jgi:hypothetical protein
MFWQTLRPLASDPAQVKSRLVRLFRNSKDGDLFTLDDLTGRIKADSKRSVAFVLAELISSRLVGQVFQVVSPAEGGGVIRQYPDLSKVPASLYDPFQLKDIDVELRMIEVCFTKHTPSSFFLENHVTA